VTTLGDGFEDDLEAAVLDDAERTLVGERDNLIAQVISRVHGRLDRYAREFNYNIESIKQSLEPVEVDRSGDELTVTFGWSHEAFPYIEFGTSDHTIEGDPVLSFVWETRHDPPEWVAEEFEQEGDGYRVFLPEVEVAGVQETRAVRDALNWLRRELQR
jgi:hypothetical protein